MRRLNFHGYLILRFHLTREIRKNVTRAKNKYVFYSLSYNNCPSSGYESAQCGIFVFHDFRLKLNSTQVY